MLTDEEIVELEELIGWYKRWKYRIFTRIVERPLKVGPALVTGLAAIDRWLQEYEWGVRNRLLRQYLLLPIKQIRQASKEQSKMTNITPQDRQFMAYVFCPPGQSRPKSPEQSQQATVPPTRRQPTKRGRAA